MTFENPPNVMKLFRSSSCSFVSAMWLVSFSMGVTHDEDTVRHLPQLRGLTARSALVAPLGQQQVVDGKRRVQIDADGALHLDLHCHSRNSSNRLSGALMGPTADQL